MANDWDEDGRMVVVSVCWRTMVTTSAMSKRTGVLWLGLFAALCGMAVSGFLYSFNAFSDALKDQLALTQSEVEWISSVANIGSCIGLTAGLFMQRFGPQLTACAAALISFAGFFLVAASVEKRIPSHFSLMCVYFFIIGQGGIFTYMACLMTTATNFSPKVRGTVIGLVDSMYGGSAAIFSAIYAETYGKSDSPRLQNVAGFFYAGASIQTAVNLFLFAALWRQPWEEGVAAAEPSHASGASSGERGKDSHRKADDYENHHVQQAASRPHQPPAINFPEDDTDSPLRQVATLSIESDDVSMSAGGEQEPLLGADSSLEDQGQPELNTLQLFTNINFQMLFWSFSLTTGVGLMFMSNVLFFLKAYGLEDQNRKLFTIIMPVFSLASRFLSGVLSDALHTRGFSRAILLVLTCSVLLVSQALLLAWPQSTDVLLFSAVSVGLSYGCMWCLVPTMMTNLGGLKYFGQNWGIVMLSSALAGMGYQALYGKVYDGHVQPATPPPVVHGGGDWDGPRYRGDSPTASASTCYGTGCFALTTYVTTASCALALLLVILFCVLDQRSLSKRKTRRD